MPGHSTHTEMMELLLFENAEREKLGLPPNPVKYETLEPHMIEIQVNYGVHRLDLPTRFLGREIKYPKTKKFGYCEYCRGRPKHPKNCVNCGAPV